MLTLGPKQQEEVFASLPTGGGKSLLYSWLPGVFDKVCRLQSLSFVIVASPLAALVRECELWPKN